MKLVYKTLNGDGIRKAISIGLLLGILTFGAVGDSWSGISVKANGAVLHCKVMPLGDSITTGKYSGTNTSPGADSDDIGYRKDLHDQLELAGYSIDFVGTISNGSTYPFSDPQHEGHNGWRDDQIAANIYNNGGENWLSQNPADVILLHIGTNSLTSDETQVEDILDEIDEFEGHAGSKVIVIVARIIDQVPNEPTVNSFNNNVEDMVTGRSDYGTELFMVDMEDGAGLNYSIWPGDLTGDMIDYLHPYATGYTKMANTWFTRYNQVIGAAPVNTAPNITNPGTQSDAEGSPASLQIVASDPDAEAITYAAYNLPPGLSINSSGLISGTISASASNNSPYAVKVVVADGNICGNSSVSFTWNVSGVNYPPEIDKPVPNQNDDEGDSVSLQITADDPNLDDLTYSTTNLPSGLSINQSGLISGQISHYASGESPYAVRVTVEDDGNPALSDYVDFTWTVHNKNGPPVISPISDQDDWEGTTINPPLEINAVDPDGDNYLLEANNLPPGLGINAFSGDITGTIAFHAVTSGSYKDYLVEIVARDDQNPSNNSKEYFVWRVRNISGPPLVINPGNQFSQINDDVSLQINATDPDGDDISYTAEELPPNLVINPTTGLITGKVAEWAFLGNTFSVKVTVTDDSQPPQSTEVDFSWIISKGEIYIPVMIH